MRQERRRERKKEAKEREWFGERVARETERGG